MASSLKGGIADQQYGTCRTERGRPPRGGGILAFCPTPPSPPPTPPPFTTAEPAHQRPRRTPRAATPSALPRRRHHQRVPVARPRLDPDFESAVGLARLVVRHLAPVEHDGADGRP